MLTKYKNDGRRLQKAYVALGYIISGAAEMNHGFFASAGRNYLKTSVALNKRNLIHHA